jgi:hypothetical protein
MVPVIRNARQSGFLRTPNELPESEHTENQRESRHGEKPVQIPCDFHVTRRLAVLIAQMEGLSKQNLDIFNNK